MTSFVRAAALSVLAILSLFFGLLCSNVKAQDAAVGAWGMAIVLVVASAAAWLFARAQERYHPKTPSVANGSGVWGNLAATATAWTILNIITGDIETAVIAGAITALVALRYRIALQERGIAISFHHIANAIAIESLVLIVPIAGTLVWHH